MTITGSDRGRNVNRYGWLGRYYSKVLTETGRKYIYGLLIQSGKIYCLTAVWDLLAVSTILKNSSLLQISSLVDLVAVDNPKATDGRFTLTYCFWSYTYSLRLFIRTFVTAFVPVVSLCSIFASSNWLEREVWDLFGVKFILHPDLRRILTDYGFQGHPLRKDFPLMGFVEISYVDSVRSILFEPVELSQDFRFFKFEASWLNWK